MNTHLDSDRPAWTWHEGTVDRRGDHLALFHGELEEPVALVGPASERAFPVEFADAIPDDARAAATRELDYYLVELGEDDPWRYAIYHCGQGANLYASVHWSWFPAGHASEG